MAVQEEAARVLSGTKNALKALIQKLGGTVADSAKIDGYAAMIEELKPHPGIFWVDITANVEDNGATTFTCNRTNTEIYEAFSSGALVIAICIGNPLYICVSCNDRGAHFICVDYSASGSICNELNIVTSDTNNTQAVTWGDAAVLLSFPITPDNANKLISFDPVGSPCIVGISGLLYGDENGCVQSVGFLTEEDNGKFLRAVDGTWEAKAVVPTDIGAASEAHSHQKKDIVDFPAAITPKTHASTHASGGTDAISPASIGAAPAYLYSTTDLEEGVSQLATGQLYFVYE